MQRILGDVANRRVDFAKEFLSQARLAVLVPVVCLGEVRLGLGPDIERKAHFRREVMRE